MNLLILAQCPSGTTTSYLASEAMSAEALGMGWDVTCEVHSTLHPIVPFGASQIDSADLVIVISYSDIDLSRFDGKKVFFSSAAKAVLNPKAQLNDALTSAEVLSSKTTTNVEENEMANLNIVAITACPTGVAHTFMAAEALAMTAEKLGHTIKVETRGSIGSKNTLTEDEIAKADLVILAVDIEVDTAPFAGKKLFRCSTGDALKKSEAMINAAISDAKVEQTGSAVASASKKEKTGPYKHLMTGVSFMLPVVVAGGLIIALSFIFGIEAFKEEGTLAAALMTIGGGSAFALMIPVLAGYISFSIADRPGLAPGLVGGMLASSIGAGFLGGIIAGFLAGYTAKFLADNIRLPQTFEALKPILIIPLIATLVTGLVMIYIVGGPVAAIMTSLTEFLTNMGSANKVVLGLLLGAMMCFDLGGPVNKAAYAFGVGLLASKSYLPMAAIMAAGMTPAIGMGIATFFGRKYFTDAEHEAGKASFVLGFCFISEGAIPFAAKDPLRVIPVAMVGGAVTGALSMLIGAELLAPHGGIFVLFIPNAITHVAMYIGSIAIGSLITGFGYLMVKGMTDQSAAAKA